MAYADFNSLLEFAGCFLGSFSGWVLCEYVKAKAIIREIRRGK